MRYPVLRAAALSATAMLAPALLAAEDLTIVSKVTIGKAAPAAATTYISANAVRTSDGENDTIVHADGRMVFINHKKKEYWEATAADMSAFFRQIEAQMAGNPVMEKMMGGVGKVDVTKGSGARQIAGYDTQQYVLSMGENFRFEIWAAPGLGVPQQYFDAQKAAYAAMGPMGKRFEKIFDEMKEIKGYPLATSMSSKMMMMKQEKLTEATEVKKGPIPASSFEVPAGYKKVKSPFEKK